MVAYSFKRQFVEPILAGTKGGTIRAVRKWRYGAGRHSEIGGHAFPGEELQLYTGMRTKQCQLIARKTCIAVDRITLDFRSHQVLLSSGYDLRIRANLDRFAQFDGFDSFDEMIAFWRPPKLATRKTGPWPMFHGWHIRWAPLPWEAVRDDKRQKDSMNMAEPR